MNIEKMTQQEEEVMRYVWLLGRCTVKDIVTEMPEPQPPYTTVASVINNLKRKGYVEATRKGNGYEYVPAVKEATYKQSFLCRVLCTTTLKTRFKRWFLFLPKKTR